MLFCHQRMPCGDGRARPNIPTATPRDRHQSAGPPSTWLAGPAPQPPLTGRAHCRSAAAPQREATPIDPDTQTAVAACPGRVVVRHGGGGVLGSLWDDPEPWNSRSDHGPHRQPPGAPESASPRVAVSPRRGCRTTRSGGIGDGASPSSACGSVIPPHALASAPTRGWRPGAVVGADRGWAATGTPPRPVPRCGAPSNQRWPRCA
jgi:hypothetical protein